MKTMQKLNRMQMIALQGVKRLKREIKTSKMYDDGSTNYAGLHNAMIRRWRERIEEIQLRFDLV